MSNINKLIRFNKGNTLPYEQDKLLKQNIDNEVIFTIIKEQEYRYKLIAVGYGHPLEYGNGAIYVNKDIIDNILKEKDIPILLQRAYQMQKEHEEVMSVNVYTLDKDAHLRGIKVGIDRIIKLIERHYKT